MNTIREDFNRPLPRVQRWWIRRPVVIILTIGIIPFSFIYHGIEGAIGNTVGFYCDCWNYDEDG